MSDLSKFVIHKKKHESLPTNFLYYIRFTMKYAISHPSKKLIGSITLTASKSESNRALIIQALNKEKFDIHNLATAEDTRVLQGILNDASTSNSNRIYDVGAAGTAMRFLTAYFSTQAGTHILTGSERMKNRPIGVLVNALRDLGADITYLEKEGYPPLKINGKTLTGTEVEMDGSVSSQFISALLLIAPKLPNGLVIKFKGEVTSKPYVNMTLKMMEEFRVYGQWHPGYISVSKQNYHKKSEPTYLYEVSGDWSSASYWYAIAALAKEVDFTIKGLKHPCLQGDSVVADIFTFLGVKTTYGDNEIHLSKIRSNIQQFTFDFSDCPDLAQTVAVTVSALGIVSLFNGLSTLKIKETDRINALKNELEKLNTEVRIISDGSIQIISTNSSSNSLSSETIIDTYGDHRMALAFSALAMLRDDIQIQHPEVVSKSYPDFWEDLKSIGFEIKELS